MNINERLDALRADVSYLNDAMRGLIEDNDDLSDAQRADFDEGRFLRDCLIAEGIDLDERQRALVQIEESTRVSEPASGDGALGAPNIIVKPEDPYSDDYVRTVGIDEAVKRTVGESAYLAADETPKAEVLRKTSLAHTDPDNMRGFGEYWLRHSSPEYTRGFFKLVNGEGWRMTAEEQDAVLRARQFDSERALSLTAANGGALIPAHLDPTVILTNAGTINPFRQISRVVPTMSNVWTGVTSAGVTFGYATEGGDSTDRAPTFQSPSVTCYRYDGTVPVSVEAEGDIEGLAAEVARELADARNRLEGSSFATGSGTNAPTGVVTALQTETARHYDHATNSAFTATDLIGTQNDLDAAYQPNASWVGSLTYHNRVRQFGDSNYYGRSSTLDQGVSASILGKPAYEASAMTSGLTTGTNFGAFVYGDFSGFVIADRVGMAVEFVPHLFSTGNGLPNGQRGWWAWGRHGSDVVSNTSFVLSNNPAV